MLEGKKESWRETDRSRGSETQGSSDVDSVPSGKEEGSQGHRQMPGPKLHIRGKGQAGQVWFGRRRTGTDRQTDRGGSRTHSRDDASQSASDLVPREKGEGRRRENQDQGAAGLMEAGMGLSMADAKARQPWGKGRRRERLRDRD